MLSLAMIVCDEEEALGACLAGIKDHVDEIVVVDTGSVDKSREVAAAHGAHVYDFTPKDYPEAFATDDPIDGAPGPFTGATFLADFAAARNLSFERASGDYIIWLDADEEVTDPRLLRSIVAGMKQQGTDAAWLKHEVERDTAGRVTCEQQRERIIKRGTARWSEPVHETLTLGQKRSFHTEPSIRQQQRARAPRRVAYRYAKILLRHVARLGDKAGARAFHYLGNELRFIDPERAIGFYNTHLRLAWWAEEKARTRLNLGAIHERRSDRVQAWKEYAAATVELPELPEPWFALARMAYFDRDWQKCVLYTEKGFTCDPSKLSMWSNPLERLWQPHVYYNVALFNVGRIHEALTSAEAGLRTRPENDKHLSGNIEYYRRRLGLVVPKIAKPVT